MKPEYKPFVDALIELAIREDIGDGDHTSLCCIPATEKGRMRLLCKQEGILAGIEIAQLVLRRLDPDMQFEQILRDGDRVKPGDVAFYVSGRLQSLMQAEHVITNKMQRINGVSTSQKSLPTRSKTCIPKFSTRAKPPRACAYWTRWPSRSAAVRITAWDCST